MSVYGHVSPNEKEIWFPPASVIRLFTLQIPVQVGTVLTAGNTAIMEMGTVPVPEEFIDL